MNKYNKKIINIFSLYILILLSIYMVVELIVEESSTNKILVDNALKQLDESEVSINEFIKSSKETLLFINKQTKFKEFIQTNKYKEDLENLFLSYINNNPNFMQLSFIDKQGFERLRVKRDNVNTLGYIIPNDKLQDKSNRYYFLDSQSKALNKIWISKLDSNIENNKIEMPRKLTFRVLLPIEDKNGFAGVLKVNYQGNNFLGKLYNIPLYDLLVFNKKGDDFFNYDKYKSNNIEKTFPKEYKNILSKNFYETNTFASKQIHIEDADTLYFILKIKQNYLDTQEDEKTQEYLLISISVTLLSILLGLGIYKILNNTLTNLEETKKINKELEDTKERWKFAVEGNNDGLWDWNLENDEVYFSPQWKKMLGFNVDEIKNNLQEWEKRVHPDDIKQVYNDIEEHLKGNTKQYINEHRVLCKDGSYKWILARGVIVKRDINGKPMRMIGTQKDIEDRKKLIDELQLVKNRFTKIFQEHSAIMLLIDPSDQSILDANKSAQEFYGYSNSEFKKMKISDLNMLSVEEIKVKMKKAKEQQKNHFVFKHKLKNGEVKDVDVNASPVKTPNGDILFSIIEDVTQKIENEKELDRIVKLLKEAQAIAKLGIWELDVRSKALEWSDEIYNIFEIDKKRFTPSYEKFLEVIHPDDRQKVKDAYENSLQTKEKYEITHRLKLPDGRVKYVQEQCDTKFDEKGNPIKSIGTVYDITHIHELTQTIEDERYKYQKLMENSSDAILITDMDGKLVDFSKMAKKQFRYTKEEMYSLSIPDWDIKLSKDEVTNITTNLKAEPTNFETIHRRKDGSTYVASVFASKVKLHDKDYIYASVRDISKQKELENKLIEQKEEFESIFRYSKDGIAITDLNTNFLDFNDAYLDITGFNKEELLTKSCIGLTAPEHKEKAKEILSNVESVGFIENLQKDCIVNNNKRIVTNMSASLLPDKKRLLLVLKDVTSLKQVEEQSRLIAMGEMIGNIAHQWRQPLSVISTSASGLKFKFDLDENLDKEFVNYITEKIVEQTKYLSKTIDDFRNFIKDDKEYKELSVKDVVESSLSLVEAVLKNNYIDLISNIEDDITIIGNKNELQQALINILNNAKDIIKEKVDDDEQRYIFISTKRVDENSLELSILDSAGGIKEDIINRIFEPYFTTKHQSVGTGLGLSMVDKIIRERHGFNITAHNEEYEYENKKIHGACFTIIFTAKQS